MAEKRQRGVGYEARARRRRRPFCRCSATTTFTPPANQSVGYATSMTYARDGGGDSQGRTEGHAARRTPHATRHAKDAAKAMGGAYVGLQRVWRVDAAGSGIGTRR